MARKNVENNETETKVKAVKYEIAWPMELDRIQPIMRVEVSATRTALVYETKEWFHPNHGGHYQLDGFKIVYVITKTGLRPQGQESDDRFYYHRGDKFYTNMLEVKLAIQDYSLLCQPKVKTVTQKVKVEVNGDDE